MQNDQPSSWENSSVRIPASACSFPGFRAWTHSERFPEEGHISFVGEEIYIDMSPERLDSHNKVKTEITRVVANVVVEDDLGNFYSDRTRVVNELALLSNEPDGVFGKWETFESGKLRQVPSETEDGDYAELEGSPDWVMEIVSPSSEHKDTKALREKYHRAGVAEYWLIDARGDKVSFQILQHRRAGYVAAPKRGKWQTSAVFARRFQLTRHRDRLGQWQYRLEVQ